MSESDAKGDMRICVVLTCRPSEHAATKTPRRLHWGASFATPSVASKLPPTQILRGLRLMLAIVIGTLGPLA